MTIAPYQGRCPHCGRDTDWNTIPLPVNAEVERLQAKVRELEFITKEQLSRLTALTEGITEATGKEGSTAILTHIGRLEAENAELRAKFTKLDQPKYSGDPMLDAWLAERDPEFTAEIAKLPATYWARYDLSAVRIGYEIAKRKGAK